MKWHRQWCVSAVSNDNADAIAAAAAAAAAEQS